MKAKLTKMLLGATLLFASANSGWALPPRQHAVRGVIESIDQRAHTLTIAPAKGGNPLVFFWKDSTRFSRKGGCAKCGFDSGQTVHGWYRREVGQNVLREVSTKGASAACGAACRVETNPPKHRTTCSQSSMTTTKKEA